MRHTGGALWTSVLPRTQCVFLRFSSNVFFLFFHNTLLFLLLQVAEAAQRLAVERRIYADALLALASRHATPPSVRVLLRAENAAEQRHVIIERAAEASAKTASRCQAGRLRRGHDGE